jgi:hypothetical protein
MKRPLVIVLIVIILPATAWWTAALAIAGSQLAWLREALVASYAAGVLAVLILVRPFWRAIAIWGLAFAALLAWWSSIRPSNHRGWLGRRPWQSAHLPQHPKHRLPKRDRLRAAL